MKLRHKLNYGFSLAVILPTALVAWLHSAAYLKNAEAALDANTLAITQSTAMMLDAFMLGAARDLHGLVAASLPKTGDRAPSSQQLATYTYIYPYFNEILWVSPRGLVLASSNPAHQGQALSRFHEELADELSEVLLKPAGEIHLSDFDDLGPAQRADFTTGALKQNALTLQLLLRVDAENAKALGVMIAVLNNQAIVDALQNLQQNLPEAKTALLLNSQGKILLSSDPLSVPLKPHPLTQRILPFNASTSRCTQFASAIGGQELDYILVKLAGAGTIQSSPWLLLASHSDMKVIAQIRHTLYRTLFIFLAIISMVLFLSLRLVRSIMRPIEALSLAAERIGDGDLTARAPSGVKDELGNLGFRFNTMAEMIERERGQLEQKVIERTARLEQARLEVEQASRNKDEFLAAISHELKTPLNQIIGFSELLKEGLVGELDAKQKSMAQDIFKAGNKQLAIVNSLIELARLQAGKVTLQAERQDPAKLLDVIAARQAAKAQAAGLTFTVEETQGLGEMPLDREVVTRLLDLLLTNAFKFTPSGGKVNLTARRVPRGDVPTLVRREAREYLELAVADNGPGIASETLPRLFQPFVQSDGHLTRSHEGIGVGLALVKLLAELHGGGSGVESEPGHGAKFLVWLPCEAL